MSYKGDTLWFNRIVNQRVICECGHSVVVYKEKKICSWCGKYVYKNKKIEFKEKLVEKLKEKENKKNVVRSNRK